MGLMRTYREIADILAEREGTPTSPQSVAQICRMAEMKILHALLVADQVIRGRLHRGAVHSHQAM